MGRVLAPVALLILACTSLGLAQAPPLSSQTANDQDRGPFAAYDMQLDRAAESGLAHVVVQMPGEAVDAERSANPTSGDSVAPADAQQNRQSGRNGINAAMFRIAALRPRVEPILRSEGIPTELASVIVVESGGRADALSPKGALGLWQLMPDTARRYGLEVTPNADERLSVEKSTRAAARYLRDLYQQFGSWPLALAGYNAGERTLQRSIKRGGTSDFAKLSDLRLLPQETRNYVPAVYSAVQLFGTRQLQYHGDGWGAGVSTQRVFAVSYEPRSETATSGTVERE